MKTGRAMWRRWRSRLALNRSDADILTAADGPGRTCPEYQDTVQSLPVRPSLTMIPTIVAGSASGVF